MCLENLEFRSVSDEVTEYGFTCSNCDVWEHSHYENIRLHRDLKALDKLSVTSKKFAGKFDRTRKKFENLQKRMHKG